MFSTLWQDAICHSNEPLCGKKRSRGTFLKMSGSRECKVCNTVNSSGPALQGRGLPVYPFLRGTIHAKLRQEIEYLRTSVEEPALFIWENRTETTVRTACSKMNSLDLSGAAATRRTARYTLCSFIFYATWNNIIVLWPHYSKSKRNQKCTWLTLL